jgi:AAA ATPase domain
MTAVFVGRERELGSLTAAVRRAADGGAGAAFVVGDPGSGKTRLVFEACAQVEVEHRFWVVGYEAERQVPLAAAAGLLRALSERGAEGERLAGLLLPGSGEPGRLGAGADARPRGGEPCAGRVRARPARPR